MRILLMLMMVCAGSVHGQNINQMKFTGQPLLYTKEGNATACGIRIFGFDLQSADKVTIVDTSVNLNLTGPAFVKFTISTTTLQDLSKNKAPTRYRVIDGWMKTPGEPGTTPINKKMYPGEDKFSLLYGTTVASALTIFSAQLAGKPINIAIRKAGEPYTVIYAGPVELTSDELDQLRGCLKELISQMEKTN